MRIRAVQAGIQYIVVRQMYENSRFFTKTSPEDIVISSIYRPARACPLVAADGRKAHTSILHTQVHRVRGRVAPAVLLRNRHAIPHTAVKSP